VITIGDLMAADDVLVALGEESDQLEPDQAIAMLEALGALKSRLSATEGLIRKAVKDFVEEAPRQLGDRLYAAKPDGKWRTYHVEVGAAVVGHSVVDRHTGEVRDAKAAAERAVQLMTKLYVSPADKPKAGGLLELDLDLAEVSKWEKTGTTLVVTDLSAPEGA